MIAVSGLVGLILIISQLVQRADTGQDEGFVTSQWSVVVRVDGSMAARQLDATELAFSEGKTIEVGPASAAVVDVRFTTNGVVQLLANGDVRWLGLFGADDKATFTERMLWETLVESAPNAVRIGAAGASVFLAIENGQGVHFVDPEGQFALLRLAPEGRGDRVEVGGAGEFLGYATPIGELHLIDLPRDLQAVYDSAETRDPVELVDARAAVLMRFEDGSVVGHHVDSGVSYEIWPSRSGGEPAIAVAGTPTVSIVVDRAGVLHRVSETRSTVLDVPNDLEATTVTSDGDAASAVLEDGSVVHFGFEPDTEVTLVWPATTNALDAGLIEASTR